MKKKTGSKPKPIAGIAIMVKPIAKGKLPVKKGRISSGNGDMTQGGGSMPGPRMT